MAVVTGDDGRGWDENSVKENGYNEVDRMKQQEKRNRGRHTASACS